jgi:hypothetical protein
MSGGAAHEANRAGVPDILRSMQRQATGSSTFDADEFSKVFDGLDSVARDLGKHPHAATLDEGSIVDYLTRTSRVPGRLPDPGGLVRALALGSVALPGERPD